MRRRPCGPCDFVVEGKPCGFWGPCEEKGAIKLRRESVYLLAGHNAGIGGFSLDDLNVISLCADHAQILLINATETIERLMKEKKP